MDSFSYLNFSLLVKLQGTYVTLCVGGCVRINGFRICMCLMVPVTGKTEVYDHEPAVHSFFTSILPYTFQE